MRGGKGWDDGGEGGRGGEEEGEKEKDKDEEEVFLARDACGKRLGGKRDLFEAKESCDILERDLLEEAGVARVERGVRLGGKSDLSEAKEACDICERDPYVGKRDLLEAKEACDICERDHQGVARVERGVRLVSVLLDPSASPLLSDG